MKRVQLFEQWYAVNEIGDGSAKAFNWKEDDDTSRKMKKLAEKVLKMEINEYEKDLFMYMFENDKGQKYRVVFNGWFQRIDPGFSFDIPGSKPKSNLDQYESFFTLSFDTEEGYLSFDPNRREQDTNRGETFRIMSTVTEIAFDFLEKAEKTGYPVKAIEFTGKADDKSGSDGIEGTKRGRMYLMYVKKQLKNLKTKSDYTAKKDRIKTSNGVVDTVKIVLGKWTGGNVIKESLEYYPGFDGVELTGYVDGNKAKLDHIEVKAAQRGSGIGSKAVADFEKWAKKNGAKYVEIDAYKKSISFWDNMGYELEKDFAVMYGYKQDYKTGIKKL